MSAKKNSSPSIFGVYFFAVLIALFSALLGFVYMTSFPARVFYSQDEYEASLKERKEPIPAPKPGDAYYVEGSVLQSGSWEIKRTQLASTEVQTVELSAGEINAWMEAKFRSGVPAASEKESGVMIVPGTPNVAITEAGTMYLNLPASIDAFGRSGEFMIFARCVIDAEGIQLKTVNVSSALVPMPELLGRKLLGVIAQGYQSTEEYTILSEAFARANSIESVGGKLLFNFR